MGSTRSGYTQVQAAMVPRRPDLTSYLADLAFSGADLLHGPVTRPTPMSP